MSYTDDEFRAWAEAAAWTTARTPEAPHQYVMMDRVPDVDAYRAAVETIQARGVDRRWRYTSGHRWNTYRYFHLDGWEYWAMWLNAKHFVKRSFRGADVPTGDVTATLTPAEQRRDEREAQAAALAEAQPPLPLSAPRS